MNPAGAQDLPSNNGVAVLDMRQPNRPRLANIFSTGTVLPRAADLRTDARIDFSQQYPTDTPVVRDGAGNPIPPGSRFPDAIAVSPDGSVIYTADEGEMNFTGGRGFSYWRADGRFINDDGGDLERAAVAFSHYPEGRSRAKGIEVEGVEAARFGRSSFLFVLSERGSFMAVYDIDRPDQPRLIQLLPTGISPEGIIAIPDRDLVVTADEVSGTLTIFQGVPRFYLPPVEQPMLYSADFFTPFAAISGLCAGVLPGQFFGVPDNALPTAIYSIQTGSPFAPVTVLLPVRKEGVQAPYDGEGNATTIPNMLVQVNNRGDVIREIQLPNALDAAADKTLGGSGQNPALGGRILSNGFEGLTLSTDGRYMFAAIQREFSGEFPTGPKYARIARYDLQQLLNPGVPRNGLRFGGDWDFFYYRLETNDPINWPGLSEITTIGNNRMIVIERDKGIGSGSTLKRIYAFSPYEKIEGIAVSEGVLWIGLDNDGGMVESRLRSFGQLGNPFGLR